ncbi:MAG: ABC transporter substrate-binding protein [Burkholderiales bacterium]|nr:ABC transporter substrate-binding protein [Burkholderiales bacterium]
MTQRRTFLAAVAAGLAIPSRSASAQAIPKVGWLQLSSAGQYAEVTKRGFLKGLREAGYEEGRNVEIVRRAAEHDLRKLRALARELVAQKVDVIFAPAKPMADAAWYASRAIPTVIATVTDPVLVDYAVSLARPGKHITGVTTANAELIGKRMQLLAEMVPGMKRLGTLIDPDLLRSCTEEVELMEKAAVRLGLSLERIPVAFENLDLEAAMKRALANRIQALITAPMTSDQDLTEKMSEVAAKHRLPFMHDVPQLAGSALAVYGPDTEDIFRRAARYVARILKGEKPAAMAIEEPREFRLIVNRRVARQLGLTLSQAVLLRADEVIE